jgi:hypothetical protein
MTYTDLVREWAEHAKANGLIDIKFFPGDDIEQYSLEERARAFCELMTGPEVDVSDLDL